MEKATILLVDDEENNLDALERLFRRHYNILRSTSGKEALGLLKSNKAVVIISDQRMPNMTGVEFLKKSIDIVPNAIRILLTGYTDIESVIAAINSGQVYRYVTKPWDPVDLLNTVEKAVEKYTLRADLKTALDELKVLDEAKTNFMLLINHELKTPLTAISSYVQLLEETDMDEMQTKSVSRIHQSYERLEKLVNDSLNLVRAESGEWKIKPKNQNLQNLATAAINNQQPVIDKKGLTVSLNFKQKDLKMDVEALKIIIDQLIDNACKFSDKNSEITVSCIKNQFSVTNTGKKFDTKKIEQLLKPFTLDENALNHSTGTGLGLSICQALLKLHDSQIDVSSSKNQTTISFTLT